MPSTVPPLIGVLAKVLRPLHHVAGGPPEPCGDADNGQTRLPLSGTVASASEMPVLSQQGACGGATPSNWSLLASAAWMLRAAHDGQGWPVDPTPGRLGSSPIQTTEGI
jgi:hypothetical protein